MKKALLLLTFNFIGIFLCLAQTSSIPLGYKLNRTPNPIKVIQYFVTNGSDGKKIADSSIYKYWDFHLPFSVEESELINGIQYVKIFISNDAQGKIGGCPIIVPTEIHSYTIQTKDVKDRCATQKKKWETNDLGKFIVEEDYNTFLLIKKDDFDNNKKYYYTHATFDIDFSAVTLPFKVHGGVVDNFGHKHTGSLFNSNFTIGSGIEPRWGLLNNVLGLNPVFMFGYSNINQNSSNNTSLTGTASGSMDAFTYGGGFVVDISKKFQVGVVLAWDHGFGDNSSFYIYQNKQWWALSVNFSFLDFKNNLSNYTKN